MACAVEGEGYTRHCAVMLQSLLSRNHGRAVAVEYLHGTDTSSRGRRRLREMVERLDGVIRFHLIPDRWLAGLPVKGFTRRATWYRVFLDRLGLDATRVLYLDVDLLVMDSLLELWDTPLGDAVVAAVSNVPMPFQRAYTERAELEGDAYFNAGVLLCDLDRVRREGIGEQLREFSVRNARRLHWRDQDALNEVLHARRLHLHPRWNCMNALLVSPLASAYFNPQELMQARTQAAIRHFEGPGANKPWHLLADHEARRLYSDLRRQTPWPRFRPSGCTPRNLLTRVRSPGA